MRRSSFQKVDAENASVDVMLSRDIISQYDKIAAVADSIDEVVVVADSVDSVAAVAANIGVVTTIGTHIDAIVEVNDSIADVHTVANNIATINQVASNVSNIASVANEVVPNITEILQADTNAATATSMAVTATAQAGLANAARVAAEVAQGIAEAKADEASLSMVAADISADLAAASASTAGTKAGEASASATAAHNSELAAAAILDSFDDRYLGAFASNPTADNDGNALTSGALYFNTTTHNLKVYDAELLDWIALSDVTFAGLQDVNLTSVTTGDVLKWNGTDWVNTKAIGLNSLQLLGGTSTQGTMTWNADEETVDVVQNGAVLQLGQEAQVHVRNNSGSSIADGKVVMATGTLGVSGRITAGLYDGTSDVKYVLGVATETIANGDDGKVTSFGKIRGINTSAWNEGDVLYTTTAGGLTNVAPTAGVKLAVAMVITKHAINGVIMVRVNVVNELAYEPKNTNIQTHIANTSNPHAVTKAQVGLGSVDNTADVNKNVLSATKWTTGRTITIGATGKTVDGSGNVSWSLAEIGAQASGNYQPLDATLTALAGITTAADKVIYATGIDTFGTSTLSAFGRTLIDDADATTARATLGVVIGTNVQAYDAGLLSIAGLTTAADKMIYTTASDVYATATLTAAGRALIDDADAAAQRTTLGISATNTPSTAVGGISATNVQAAIQELDSKKADIASPVFTGNVTGLGVATGTSFNAITGLASAAPLISSTAAVGTSTAVARQDHVHPAQTTITGNAGTATTLQTARTINGVSFNGSANINIEDRLGTPIASAATTTIGTAGLGDYIHITGTTTITSFGTAATAGIRRTLIFDGALSIAHNATSLICVGGVSIVTVAGMVIEVVAETTANWRVVSITHPSLSATELGYIDSITRADKYLASLNIAAMVYTGSDLTKIQYINATDVNYEILGYTSGNLTTINHYVASVLKGTTTLTYTSGNLVSAIFVGV